MARRTKKGRPAPEEDARETAADAPQGGEELSLEALRAERDDYMERWKRAAADYQNLRRRELSDTADRVRRAVQPVLEKMLVVLDYLDMALACPTTHEESKNLAIGVRLTRDQFLQALDQEEVRPIPVDGPFDPSLHEATGTAEREDLEPGSIVEVVRAGYTWRGEILRYAHVIVAKGGAEPGPSDEEAGEG